jgi:hypothetical protein
LKNRKELRDSTKQKPIGKALFENQINSLA